MMLFRFDYQIPSANILVLTVLSAFFVSTLAIYYVVHDTESRSTERTKFPRPAEVEHGNENRNTTETIRNQDNDNQTFQRGHFTKHTITTFPHLSRHISPITIVCISDTHGHHRELTMPKGDILIHAGDFTLYGRDASVSRDAESESHMNTEDESPLRDFNEWLGGLEYKYKIIVNGNHEYNAQWKHRAKELLSNGILLVDESLEINLDELQSRNNNESDSGSKEDNVLRIYGMQFYWPTLDGNNPYHGKIDRNKPMDILITHTPVDGYVDRDRGCPALRKLVHRMRPKIVICGHEHMATGIVENHDSDEWDIHSGDDGVQSKIVYVNAANAKGGIRNGHALGKEPIVLSLISPSSRC